jgi:hypothetical protein
MLFQLSVCLIKQEKQKLWIASTLAVSSLNIIQSVLRKENPTYHEHNGLYYKMVQ